MTTINEPKTNSSNTTINSNEVMRSNISSSRLTQADLPKSGSNGTATSTYTNRAKLSTKSPANVPNNTSRHVPQNIPINIGYVNEYLMRRTAVKPCREDFKHAFYKAWLEEDSHEKDDQYGFLSTHGSHSSGTPRRVQSPFNADAAFSRSRSPSRGKPTSIALANCSRHWKHQNEHRNTGIPHYYQENASDKWN
jgi:hypothetical protein